MTVYKCKTCGGNLIITPGEDLAICENCGNKQSFPKIDDDEIANRFNQATIERINYNFDTALSLFNEIIVRDPQNADAHWNAMLCRYGINYQEDPRTGKQIPYINRTQRRSVFDDADYLKAIEFAEPSDRNYYEDEAEKIERIRDEYIQIASAEKPYDVFICFKDSVVGNERNRTIDSVRAEELYDVLIRDGYKVFFSRVTLRDNAGGKEWEPIIYNALTTAKVMFVFGSKAEHVNYGWVKNEWERYLSIINEDRSKRIIPVFKNKNINAFPLSLSKFQGFDMDTPGWYQDAKHSVESIIGRRQHTHYNNSSENEQLASSGETFMRLGEIDKAKNAFQTLSEKFPHDYRGWWGLATIETDNFSNPSVFEEETKKSRITTFIRHALETANEKKSDIESTYKDFLHIAADYETDKEIQNARERIKELNDSINKQMTLIEKYQNNIKVSHEDLKELDNYIASGGTTSPHFQTLNDITSVINETVKERMYELAAKKTSLLAFGLLAWSTILAFCYFNFSDYKMYFDHPYWLLFFLIITGFGLSYLLNNKNRKRYGWIYDFNTYFLLCLWWIFNLGDMPIVAFAVFSTISCVLLFNLASDITNNRKIDSQLKKVFPDTFSAITKEWREDLLRHINKDNQKMLKVQDKKHSTQDTIDQLQSYLKREDDLKDYLYATHFDEVGLHNEINEEFHNCRNRVIDCINCYGNPKNKHVEEEENLDDELSEYN